jgi:hypothetical protein
MNCKGDCCPKETEEEKFGGLAPSKSVFSSADAVFQAPCDDGGISLATNFSHNQAH